MFKLAVFIFTLICTVVSVAENFEINPGITGTWYNPDTSGQGLLIEVLGDQRLFVAWFTYYQEQHQWYSALGEYSGNESHLTLMKTVDGVFNQPSEVESLEAGTVNLTFTSCNEAVLEFTLESGGAGMIQLKRLVPNQICESLMNENP